MLPFARSRNAGQEQWMVMPANHDHQACFIKPLSIRLRYMTLSRYEGPCTLILGLVSTLHRKIPGLIDLKSHLIHFFRREDLCVSIDDRCVAVLFFSLATLGEVAI